MGKMVSSFENFKAKVHTNRETSWKGKETNRRIEKSKDKGKNISRNKAEKRNNGKRVIKEGFGNINTRGFHKPRYDKKKQFSNEIGSKKFKRKNRIEKNGKLNGNNETNANRNANHSGDSSHFSKERKHWGKPFFSKKNGGAEYNKDKKRNRAGNTFNSNIIELPKRYYTDKNGTCKDTDVDKKSEETIETKKQYDVFQLLNNVIENKVTIKNIDREFIKHLKTFYDMSSNVSHVLTGMLEEIVVKKVLREKTYVQYDDIIVYTKRLRGKLNIMEDKMEKKKTEEKQKLKYKAEDKFEQNTTEAEERKKEKQANGTDNILFSDDDIQRYNEYNKTSKNKEDIKAFKKKVLFLNEVEELFYIGKENGEICIAKKPWRKWIKTMLRSKLGVSTEEASWEVSTNKHNTKEKNAEIKCKEKKRTKEECKYNIRYKDIPFFLRYLYKINDRHIVTDDTNKERVPLNDNSVIDLKNVLKGKISIFDVLKIMYNVGLNLINKNFEIFVDNYAEDEEKIYLDIINDKSNIFVDRVNNISVLVKKNPLIYIMYLKVLLDLYHVKDNAFVKKSVLRCIQYVCVSILPTKKLKNIEDNNTQVLLYMLNIFYSRFNFKQYAFSSFYFFFNALLYLYSYEHFLKSLFSQYLFILQNGIYSTIPSIFYNSTTYLGQFYVEKDENRLTILNILLDAHLKITKGNPLILNMLKSILNVDQYAQRHFSTTLFEKTLANLSLCVTIIVETIKTKQKSSRYNRNYYRGDKNRDKNGDSNKIEQGKDRRRMHKKKTCILTEVRTNISEAVTKINRCLYILYKMRHTVLDDVEENIFTFAIFLFELFSVNIFDVYEQKEQFFGQWTKDKINVFNKNISEKTNSLFTEQRNLADAQHKRDQSFEQEEEGEEEGEKETENQQKNIKEEKNKWEQIQKEEIKETENDVPNHYNGTHTLDIHLSENGIHGKSLPTSRDNDQKRQQKIEMKRENKQKIKEKKNEQRKTHNLYYYLSNRSIKLLSSILLKNIYNIIQKTCSNNNELPNEPVGLRGIKERTYQNAYKETEENNKGLHILNCNSIQNIIKHMDSYQVKIHLLRILFIVASSKNQLDDDLYCYFYTTLTILDLYENDNSPSFFAMLTLLVLTDNNLSRNLSFIKRMCQYSLHSKDYWVQMLSLMTMKYIFLKKKALSNFLYFDEKQLYEKNLQNAKQLYIEKCKKYNAKGILQVDDKEFSYNAKLNNPIDSNALLTHFYEFYDFSSLLNDHFFNLQMEFQNWAKFGSTYFKKEMHQLEKTKWDLENGLDGQIDANQKDLCRVRKKGDIKNDDSFLHNSLWNKNRKIYNKNSQDKKYEHINGRNRDITTLANNVDSTVFNVEEPVCKKTDTCYTLDIDEELYEIVKEEKTNAEGDKELEENKKHEQRKERKGINNEREKPEIKEKIKSKNENENESENEKKKKEKENKTKESKDENNRNICYFADADFPTYSLGIRKIIDVMSKLEKEFFKARKYMNMYFTFTCFINDSQINDNEEEIQNKEQTKYKLSNNIYQKYYADIIKLFHQNNFRKLSDKYKPKKAKIEQMETEKKQDRSDDQSDTDEEEADQFLNEFIYKNFEVDPDLMEEEFLEAEKNKKTQKRKRAYEQEQAQLSDELNESITSNESFESMDAAYSDMSENEAKHILEFEDYAKAKKKKKKKETI